MAASRLPLRLELPTIVEALFEVRFSPKGQSVVGLLPGLIYSRCGAEYPTSVPQPLSSVPLRMREEQPELQYGQQIRLVGEDGFSVYIGDRVAGASTQAPYPGWAAFKPRVLTLIDILKSSGLIQHLERASFKYVNLLPVPPGRQLAALDLSVKLGLDPAPERGFRLRTELNDEKYARILEITTNTVVENASGRKGEGLFVAIDVVELLPGASLESLTAAQADNLHDEAKALFFKTITQSTLDSLRPIYEAGT